jgi:hypothetical protein
MFSLKHRADYFFDITEKSHLTNYFLPRVFHLYLIKIVFFVF